MLLTTTQDGHRVLPTAKEPGFCPECSERVVPKLGVVRIHHWAHTPGSACAYGRGMTEWHERWLLRHHDQEGWQIEHGRGR